MTSPRFACICDNVRGELQNISNNVACICHDARGKRKYLGSWGNSNSNSNSNIETPRNPKHLSFVTGTFYQKSGRSVPPSSQQRRPSQVARSLGSGPPVPASWNSWHIARNRGALARDERSDDFNFNLRLRLRPRSRLQKWGRVGWEGDKTHKRFARGSSCQCHRSVGLQGHLRQTYLEQ